MNKIYKVVWSKVKNCYVVVSEIAKNVISGGVKSAKVGSVPLSNGMALGALMAFVITGQAWAESVVNGNLTINENQSFNAETLINGTFGSGDRSVALGYTANASLGNNVYIAEGKTLNIVNALENAHRSYGIVLHNPANGVSLSVDGNSNSLLDLDVTGDKRVEGIRNNYKGYLDINVGSLDVYVKNTGENITSVNDLTYGIDVWDGTTTNINMESKGTSKFYVESAKGKLYGIEAWNEGKYDGKPIVNINNLDLTVKSTHENSDEADRDISGNDRIVLRGVNLHNSTVNLEGTSTDITLRNEGKFLDSSVVFLQCDNADQVTSINFNADTTNITAYGGEGVNAVEGVVASGQASTVNFNGDTVNVNIYGGNAVVTGMSVRYKGNTIVSGMDTDVNIYVDSNTDEGIRGISADEYGGSSGKFNSKGTTTVTATNNGIGDAYGVYGEENADIDLAYTTITATSVGGKATGIFVEDNSDVNVTGVANIYSTGKTLAEGLQIENSSISFGKDVLIDVEATSGDVYAARIVSSPNLASTAVFDGNLTIKADATGSVWGLFASGSDSTYANMLNGKEVRITVNADGQATGVAASFNGTVNSSVDTNVVISANSKSGEALGIFNTYVGNESQGNANINLNGNVEIIAKGAQGSYSIYNFGSQCGSTAVGGANKKVVLEGDIVADSGIVTVTFGAAGSQFDGKVETNKNGVTILNFANNAIWNVTDDSTLTTLAGTGGIINNASDGTDSVTVTIHNYNDNDYSGGTGNYSGAALTNNNLAIGEGVDLVVDTWETAIFNNNVKIDSQGDVTIKTAHDDGICAYGDVEIKAENVTIKAFDNGLKVGVDEENINGNEYSGVDNVTIEAQKEVIIKSEVDKTIRPDEETGEGYAVTNVSTNGGVINVIGEIVTLSSDNKAAVRVGFVDGENLYNGVVNVTGNTINIDGYAVEDNDGDEVKEYEAAVVFAQGTGTLNLTATNGITITDKSSIGGNAVAAYDGGVVNIKDAANVVLDSKIYATGGDSKVNITNAGNVTITEANEHGISINSGGEINIAANNVELTTGKSGIEATNGDRVDITATNVSFKSGGSYVNSEKGGAVHITNETDARSVVSIKASGNVELISSDRYAINNRSKHEGLVEVFGKNVTLISENRTAVKAGGHVGNEGLNGTVTIGNEITETITIKGRAQNPHKDNQPNEHKGAVVYAQSGTVNLSATDKIEITNTNTENRVGKAVAAYDGGNINIKDTANLAIDGEVYATGKGFVNIADVGNVTITEAEEHGISVNGSGKVDVTAENVTIDSSKAAIWLDDKGDNAVTINANGSVNLTSEDRFAVNNESVDGGLIDINGKDITIISENRTAVKAGGVLGREGKFGTIDISGEIVTIKGSAQEPYKDNQPNQHNASVVYAQGKGIINLSATDKLAIVDTAKVGGYAISAYEGAAVNIKDTNNVAVDGNVYANGEGSRVNIEANKGSINGNVEAENNASVVVNLKSKGAFFTGATNVNNAEKGVTLILQQGATWNVTGDSTVSSVCGDNFNITKASNVGVNEEVTVTLDGKHADGMHDDFESTTTNIYGVDLVIREKNESGLGGTVTLNSDSDITVEGAHHAIHTNGNDVVNITTDKLTLVNGTGFDAIRAENGGKVNIDADDVALTSKVYTNGDGSIVDIAGVNNVLITSTNGSAINNTSDGATIKIGDEGTKTVAITGATEGSREVYDNQGNFVNYNEDNRAVIYSKGTVNINANEKVVINDTGVKTKALSAYGDANVTINGGKQTTINGEITADGYSPVLQSVGNVEHQDNGIADNINVLIKGENIIVDASLEAEEGVFARGDSTGIDNAVITVGDANTEKVTVTDVDTGLFAWNGGSKVEVNSDSLVISANGSYKDSGMGICAINSSNANNKLAIVDVNAGKTEITVKDGAFAYSIYANGKSNVDVAGNIDIVANGTSAFGVEADKSATVVLGDSNSTVTFDVNADELDYEGESRAEAIAARENNSVTVLGNMNATVNGRDWVSGVESEDGSVVELGNVTLNISGSDSSEASGINVARKGAVKVNGNLEATVTGGEWASGVEAYNGSNINIGNGSSEVKLTATANGTESSDKDWGVSAFGILSVGQTKPIIADNEEDNEYAYGGSTVNINASQLTINAISSYGYAYGIYVADAGVVNVQNATNADINGKVFATGEGSQVNFTNSGDVNITETKEHGIAVNNGGKVDVTAEDVTIDSLKAAIWMEKNSGEESKSEVHITANGDVELTSKDRFAINNESKNYGVIDVSGKNVTIISESMPAIKVGERVVSEGYNGIVNVTGENITLKGYSHEIIEGWEQRASVVYTERGTINLSATDALTITDTANIGGNAVGAYSGGSVNIKNAASVAIDGSVYATGEGTKVNIVDVKDVKITSTKGSAINNASNNSVVEIGSENTETVTINGATEELQQVFGESNNLISYNEDNRAVVFSRGDVNIIATEKVEIADTNEGKAIDAHGGANVIIDGGKETVINGEVYADGHEYVLQDGGDIEHQDSGKGENINVTILGKDITVDAKGGEGVFARGDSVGGDNAVITVGDANTENITINNTTIGLFAWYDGSKVEVNGDSLKINAKGTEEDAGVGIYASNNGAVHNNPATVDVNSVQTKITVNDSGSECVGVWADSYGVVNVNGDLEVNAKNAVMATDGGNVNVNNAIDMELNGEVYATGKDSKVNFTDVGSVNITETKEHGISVNNGGKVDIVAENVTIDSYKAAIWLDDLGDNAVTIKANENVNLTSEDRFAVNNESVEGSLIDISGKNVVVTSEDRTAVKAGGTLGKEGKNGTVNISGETVSIQGFAQNTVVDGKANEHNASVVYAQGKGVVNLSAANTLTITDTAKVGGNAVSVYEGGTINIKDTANLVVDGAVYANGEGSRVNIEANKGSVNGNVEAEDNASIVVTLESKEASFTGATKVTNAEKGVTLNLQQGATWYVTGDSTVSSVIGDEFNITKATGVNEEVTVTLDGRHADDIADDYDSTTSTITGVDLILYEDNGLNGNQTIISDSDVTLHSKGNGINVVDGNYVSIQAAEFTLNQGTGFDAIRAENGGKVNIAADNAVFNGSVYASGSGSEVDFSSAENVAVNGTGSVVKVTDDAIVRAGNITLTGNDEDGKVEAIGVNKGNFVATGNVSVSASGYSAYGVEAVAGSTVEIGSSDKDVTFTITSTGVDSNLEDKEYPEAQAISAEGGSKVTVNANKLDIITTANSKVTGSLQARDNGSEITVKATDVDITGDIFAGEGAKVAINTTTFATEGIIGSEGVIDIITGDVVYGAGTQFYTEGSGAINLACGNVSGVLNIAKGNVNLTGATFTVANLNDAIKGAGKLVVDGSGVLKTTADQVFTVGDAETVDVETLGKNGINDIAKEKVTFKSGSLSLSDDYSYDYLTSITDVMKEDNGNATKLVMTGTLKNATSINPDDIETDENNQLDVNDASNLGSDVHLDNVTVKTDNNLLIGGSASKDTPVEVDGVKATDSVANGFSADGLDLGNADGAIITGGKEVTLGGSNGNDKIVSSTVESTTLVVGTGGDEPDAKGTLNIGTNNDADYKHHGKVHVNHGSDLNAKGKTKITGGIELEGGNLNVDEKGHLEADIVVESKKGNGNNGNNGNGNGNNKDKDKVTITGKVTGNLTVNNNKEAGHPSTMIHLGNDQIAGKLHAKEVELNGATLFLDPQNANDISEASMFTLEAVEGSDSISVDGNIIVGQNSVAAFGVSGADEVVKAFAKTGLSFGKDGDVNAVVYVADTIEVDSGSIIAEGSRTTANPGASAKSGTVNFADGSVLMVDAEDVENGAVIKGVKSVEIAAKAKLYIDDVSIEDVKNGETFTIFEKANGANINTNLSWDTENISTNNQLIKFTDASIVNGKLELKADGVQKVNDVYKGEVVAGDVVDKAIDTNAPSSDFFNSAVDQKVNANKASQADGVNSSLAMNEVAGVTHTTYAVSNILTDAVADHMSLANGKDHDKDIWVHYVHTKEDVDGLKYDVHSTQYRAQYNGIVVGTDLYSEGKATVGAALTYVDGNINGSSVAARTENDAKYYGASVYGSIQNNDTAVIADVSYLHGEHDITQRNSGKVIIGDPETDAFSVGVRVEKEAKAGIGKLVPYAGLRYMHLGTGNYTNSIGLAYDADDAELFLLPVGLKYSADIKNTNGWTMRPVVEFGYVWAFGDTDADQTVSLNGASNGFGYDVTDSGSYVGRFMLEAEKANISYALGYEYQKGDNVEADKWMVNVNWKF